MKEQKSKKRIVIIVGIVVAILIILSILLIGLLSALFIPEKEKIKQPEQYEAYLGESGKYKENYVGYNDIFPDMLENVSEVEMFGKRRIKYPFFFDFIFYMKRYTMNSRSEKFRYIMQFAVYAGGGQLWLF